MNVPINSEKGSLNACLIRGHVKPGFEDLDFVKASLVLLRSIVGPVSAKIDVPFVSLDPVLLCSTWLTCISTGLSGDISFAMSMATSTAKDRKLVKLNGKDG